MDYFSDMSFIGEGEMMVDAPFPYEASSATVLVNEDHCGKASTGRDDALHVMDFDGGVPGGIGCDQNGDVENIANGIDDFLDDFLALTNTDVGGMDITEGDFAWFDKLDSPPPFSPSGDITSCGGGETIAPQLAAPASVAVLEATACGKAVAGLDPAWIGDLAITPCSPSSEIVVYDVEEGILSPLQTTVSAALPVAAHESTVAAEAAAAAVAAWVGAAAATAASASVTCDAFASSVGDSQAQAVDAFVEPVSCVDRREGRDGFENNPAAEAAELHVTVEADEGRGEGGLLMREARREKVARYLAKRKRRCWAKASSYKSRQNVANARPRHRGRFLPLVSDFIPIAELQRRQRAMMKEMQMTASTAQQETSAFQED